MRLIPAIVLLVLAPVAAGRQADLRPAQMQQDFDVLRRAVEEAHGGLHRFITKPDLDKHFGAARARLERPLSTLAFASLLSETLTAVRDGHMQLEYDDATTRALGSARLLPLRVASENGRAVVIYNDAPADRTITPGMELLSVNGRPIADIAKTILSKLSSDGFIETGKAFRMARNFARNYWLYVDQASTFNVTARTAGGDVVKAALDGIASADRAESANPANAVMSANLAAMDAAKGTVSLGFPQGDAIGVLRVRAFTAGTFRTSVQAAFETLRDKRATALVLDMRGNGGGVDESGAFLVSHFVSAPFRYFDHIKVTTVRPSFATWNAATFDRLKAGTAPAPGGGFLVTPALHSGVAEQQPAAAPFLGKVVVLIDGGTFSTAADVCAQIRALTKATFIGEETGGAAEGNTSGLNVEIVLPNSGLKLRIQMYGYWNAVAAERGRGTRPDIPMLRTTTEILAGVDAPMNRAIAIAKQK